jgi:serine/threonine-protein kinase
MILDPQCAEAHVSLAFMRSVLEWDWAAAGPLFRRAITLNPGYARAHHWYGADYLAMLGQLDEALEEALFAHHLDPLSQITLEGCGYVYTLRREYDAALRTFRNLLHLDPAFFKAHSSLGRLLSLMGRYEEGIAEFEKARSLGGETPVLLGAFGQTLALAGRRGEALAVLEQLRQMSRTRWVPSGALGILNLGLGEIETALTHFEQAVDARERAVAGFKVHPLYEPLRGQPRFQKLVQRIGLAG